jgi:hypothetical protein
MVTWADSHDVQVAAKEWTEGQKTCRVNGHAWEPLTVRHRPGVFSVMQRCPRCRNERRQDVNEQGYPVSDWKPYYYDGYLLKGLGRVGADGRAVLRLDLITRLPIEEEPD